MIAQMRTKQKLYTLSHCHTHDDAQMRTTHNISHIPSNTNDLCKCVPNFEDQTKALLFLFSYFHTHDDIRNCVPHTKYHTYSVSRLCSLSYAYTHIKYFHIYMLIRICVREGLQGRTRDFQTQRKNGAREFVPGLSGVLSQRCSCL